MARIVKKNKHPRFTLYLPAQAGALKQGFTLIELMVVVSIVAFFSVVTLVSHRNFGESIAINNLAYDTALAFREAQIFGTSVRTQNLDPTGFDHPYVIRIVESENRFQQCFDLNDNNFCNLSGGELLKNFDIGKGNRIKDLCQVSAGVEDCSITRAHVSFLRPDPDATINVSDETPPPWSVVEGLNIHLESPSGLEKIVEIRNTGQISVR